MSEYPFWTIILNKPNNYLIISCLYNFFQYSLMMKSDYCKLKLVI